MNRGNPVALGLVLIGAAVMAIATFLPLYEPAGLFRMIQENSLIQHGGWLVIVAAIGIAGTGYGARNGKGWGGPFGIALLAAGGLALFAMDKGQRTLYPVSPINGTIDSSGPGTVADFGIGIYVAGLGIAMVIVGSLMLRQSEQEAVDPLETAWEGGGAGPTKKCPDCAETILADAHVCKHCGYRFPAESFPLENSEAATPEPIHRNIKCGRCNAVIKVPLTITTSTMTCPGCQANLTIPPAPTKAN